MVMYCRISSDDVFGFITNVNALKKINKKKHKSDLKLFSEMKLLSEINEYKIRNLKSDRNSIQSDVK